MVPHKFAKLIATCILLGGVSTATYAETLQDAAKAVRMQEFDRAVKIYRQLASEGEAEAQYQLGNFYAQGKLVKKNPTEAKKWLEKAAEQNLASAQYSLALLIQDSQPDRAKALLQDSAAQGYRAAALQLQRAQKSTTKRSTAPFEVQWFGAARNNDSETLAKLNAQKPSVNLEDERDRTAIFYAIESNAQKSYLWLKQNGANLNQKDKFGATPLQVALERKNRSIVQSLLKAKADSKVILANGDSLLHYALRLNEFQFVAPLIDSGAPINHQNKEGWTPLDLAEYKKAPKTTALLLEKGALHGSGWRNELKPQDVQVVAKQLSNSNLPPVAMAVINDNPKLLKSLIQKDRSLLDTRLNDDSTLIILAIKHNKQNILETLIQLGSNVLAPGFKGSSALQVAAKEQDLKATRTLLGAGASPTQTDDSGRDAIMTAIEIDALDITNALIDNLVGGGRSKSEIRVHLKSSDIPVNRYILLAAQHHMDPLIDRLLPYATDKLETDDQGRTALWFAADAGNAKLILKLLKAGIPPDHEDSVGRTPFIVAVDNGCLECARQLLGFVDINHQTKSGNTALMLASAKGDTLIAAWLIQNKADIEIRNSRGNTAIMQAVNANSTEIVTYLLKADANVSRKNKLGFSAIDLAEQTSPQMLELVKSKSVLGLF